MYNLKKTLLIRLCAYALCVSEESLAILVWETRNVSFIEYIANAVERKDIFAAEVCLKHLEKSAGKKYRKQKLFVLC